MVAVHVRSDQIGNRSSGLEYLSAAASACPHGLMVEERGRVMYANPAYARLRGFESPQQLEGRRTSEALRSGTPSTAGNAREYDTLHFDFRSSRRRMRLHVLRDITDRRDLEIRLRESEKLEALGRLVGGVAHDFNNILTAITLQAELLRELHVEQGGRHVEEILAAAQRGTDLVRQLLTFARQHPGAPQIVSLCAAITALKPVLAPLVGEDVELQTKFLASHDTVHADPTQLQQVILNLVMNARHALPHGGRIRIRSAPVTVSAAQSARRGLKKGRYMALIIEDNGCGMKESVRRRIFEPFFTTRKNGTGLGMSMVYGIATQAGGTVMVTSAVAKGTRVTVLLPAAEATPVIRRKISGDMPRGLETVLLAEDDASVRASLSELLMSLGYRVLQARDGAHAVDIARLHKAPIHLLLSDVVMPKLNGADAARAIRRLHAETKVLLVSGYPAKAGPTSMPHDVLLLKPFSRAVLARKVREILAEQPPASRAARGVPAAGGAS